jgi:uncharacterized OsmC-like protein
MNTQPDIREYTAQARSTETFGRVLGSARNHHFIIDGPIQNGCPGEEVTPAELFLGSIASCGVELVQVIAQEQNLPLTGVQTTILATLNRSQPIHQAFTVFNTLRLQFRLKGLTSEQGHQVVEAFKGR